MPCRQRIEAGEQAHAPQPLDEAETGFALEGASQGPRADAQATRGIAQAPVGGRLGAQAAARYHFGLDAERLSRTQASQLAAVLPSPLKWSAARPGPYVRQRAAWIRQQMWQLGGDDYLLRLER